MLAGLILLGAATAHAQQHGQRARDESSKSEGAAAVLRNMESYLKQVRAPNGEIIDLTPVLQRIASQQSLHDAGFRPHDGDGTTFLDLTDKEAGRRPLPSHERGYYTEYVVPPNDHARWPGPQRLIVGRKGEAYYSPNHYAADAIVALHRALK